MSLHQLPASVSAPRAALLPASVLAALSLALSACDKPKTSATIVQPSIVLPTGTLDTLSTDSTRESRQALIGEVIRLALDGKDIRWHFYTRGFTQDTSKMTDWRLAQLDLGFGPRHAGTHMVTVKQHGDTTFVYDILDADSDGDADRVEYSISSPTTAANGTKMMRSDKSYVVDDETQNMFGTGLKKAQDILEAEKQLPKIGK